MTRAIWLSTAVLALVATITSAQDSDLDRRAEDVAGFLRADPKGFEQVFSAEFLAQVPPAKLAEVYASYHQTGGKCVRVRVLSREGPDRAQLELVLEKGYRVTATLVIEHDPPHKVTGLLFGLPVRLALSLGDIAKEVGGLPGKTSLALVRLDPARPEPVLAGAPDEPIAIGSSFKLWVLAELARQLESGKHRIDEVVPLREDGRSLPSGFLHTWPAGAPVTIHTLASLMISQSDNTATDTLIRTLGRAEVESVLAETGHTHAALNVPFLTTVELFKLKGDPSGELAKKYLALDAAGRRAFLDGDLAARPRSAIQPWGKPSHVDTLEWFASANDLCRVMDWLRRHTESGRAAPLRQVLAINRGLPLGDAWSYVGFKGGSEPGVLNLTYLLRSAGGDWYALSAGWNDTKAPVDEGKLEGLVQRLAELVPLRY
jgi:hypothetical protein